MKDENIYIDVIKRYLITENLSEKSYLLNLILEVFKLQNKLKYDITYKSFNQCMLELEYLGVIEESTRLYLKTLWRTRNGLIHEIFNLKPYHARIEKHRKGSEFEKQMYVILKNMEKPNIETEEDIRRILGINPMIKYPYGSELVEINIYKLPAVVEIMDYSLDNDGNIVKSDGKVVGNYLNGKVNLSKTEVDILRNKYNLNI